MEPSKTAAQDLIPAGNHPEMHKLLDLPLDAKSVVVVIGSYQGITAQIISVAFGCELWCFDPQVDMCQQTREKLPTIGVHVREYGLGARTGEFPMAEVGNDACSFFGNQGFIGKGRMLDVEEAFREEGITHIDLLLSNCEGGEYEIFKRMEEIDMIDACRFALIQFHRVHEPEGWKSPFTNWTLLWQNPSWELWSRKGKLDD